MPEMMERLLGSGSVTGEVVVTACCGEGELLVVRRISLPPYALHQQKSVYECVQRKNAKVVNGMQVWTEDGSGNGSMKRLKIAGVKKPSCGRGFQMASLRINRTESQVRQMFL